MRTLRIESNGGTMATAVNSLTDKSGQLWKWTEKVLIGAGFAGLFLLVIIVYLAVGLYTGLAF